MTSAPSATKNQMNPRMPSGISSPTTDAGISAPEASGLAVGSTGMYW
jgi:hypothetical protein